jgi:rSAM/selenodomain-associated transferase 1
MPHHIFDRNVNAPGAAGRCALGIMTKAPQAGRVKTRLTPPLTPAEAAELNTCFLRDTATAISQAANDAPARGVGVYTPAGAESAYEEILPADFGLIVQRGEEFGDRLSNAIDDLLTVGFESVCLIDSDSPTVPQSAYARAAEALHESGDRVVLGPSDDGGYYLIGMKRLHRQLFERIDWSTERVAEQTIERATESGLQLVMLPTWYDVDDQATLQRLCAELLGDRSESSGGFEAPATRGYLRDLIAREGRARIWPDK